MTSRPTIAFVAIDPPLGPAQAAVPVAMASAPPTPEDAGLPPDRLIATLWGDPEN
jgi:hypothetical protein